MSTSSTTIETTGPSLMNIRPLNDRTKEEYRNSFGAPVGTLGPFERWHVWNVVDRVSDIWSELETQIVALLAAKASEIIPPRRYQGPKGPSHALRCYMVGLNRDRASPHGAIICDQKWFCTQIRDIVLKSNLLQDRGWAGFLRLQGEIRQPGTASPAFSESSNFDKSDSPPYSTISLYSDKLPKSLCGTRIAVSGRNGTIAIATLGGTVRLDEKIYGLTVSHAFLSSERESVSNLSSSELDLDKTESDVESDSDVFSFSFDEDDLDPFVQPSKSAEPLKIQLERISTSDLSSRQPVESPPASYLTSPRPLGRSGSQSNFSQLRRMPTDACTNCIQAKAECNGAKPVCYRCTRRNIEDSCDYGLTATYGKASISASPSQSPLELGHETGFRILNERLESTNPDPNEDDSLLAASFDPSSLGSSRWTLGSRKTFRDTQTHSFEWALMSIEIEKLARAGNIKTVSTAALSGEIPITSLGRDIPVDSNVFFLTPTGTAPAIGTGSESMVKFSSSAGYSRVYTVQSDLAEDGDCGSWAINSKGELLGMLIGSCDIFHEAYILPAPTIFAEIAKATNKLVSLPSFENVQKPEIYEDPDSIATEYLYSPLKSDEIRILTLMPGNVEAPIECYLAVCNLTTQMEYEALSYVWDRSEPLSRIRLHKQYFRVSHDLMSALKALRYVNQPRYIWVDAICINCSDVSERNIQTALMAPIMSQATNVCIWLGPEDENSALVFSTLDLSRLDQIMESDFTVNTVLALCNMAQKEWFHRRWPFQEICLAKKATILCGKYNMPWNDFAEAIALLQALEASSQAISHWFSRQRRRPERNPSSDLLLLSIFVEAVSNAARRTEDGRVVELLFSLEYLVGSLAWLNVSFPHDSIYSFLSLAKDMGRPRPSFANIVVSIMEKRNRETPSRFGSVKDLNRQHHGFVVDYSTPFVEVCENFITKAVNDSSSLDVICRPWAPVVPDLPSWVNTTARAPFIMQKNRQFRRVNANELIGTVDPGRRKLYSASKRSRPIFYFANLSDKPALCAEGFVLDSVDAKQLSALMGNIPPGWTDFLGWENTEDIPPNKFWRVLVANRDPNGNPPPNYYRRICAEAFQRMQPDCSLYIANELLSPTFIMQQFLERVQSVVWGRRLIRTGSHELVGLAPAETKKRDVVAIILGCSVPVILRPVEKSESKEGETYKLVGECFIYGMMDGEALDFQTSHGIETRTFAII